MQTPHLSDLAPCQPGESTAKEKSLDGAVDNIQKMVAVMSSTQYAGAANHCWRSPTQHLVATTKMVQFRPDAGVLCHMSCVQHICGEWRKYMRRGEGKAGGGKGRGRWWLESGILLLHQPTLGCRGTMLHLTSLHGSLHGPHYRYPCCRSYAVKRYREMNVDFPIIIKI